MKNTYLFIVLSVAAVLFFGCSDANDSSSATGRLSVILTDAPFPSDLVAEANVTIFKLDARLKGESNEIDEAADEAASFEVLMENEITVNLLDLTNGISAQLVNADVPVGSYDLIRVFVKGINVVLTDGTTYDLQVPSGSQSGIKVFIKPNLVVSGGLSSDLLLDFDVSRSFIPKGGRHDIGGITGFNFKPVIKASNMTTAGTLAGVVTTTQEALAVGLEGVQVAIFAADTLNTTAFTDVTGGYTVMGLVAGSYDVEVELEGFESQSEEGIAISAGNKTIQNFELIATEVLP
ncbi:DUF4382 domain-containing protein [Arenibacter sp. GZD96]|uniref:DUF4382 domain-containing protein n=1 Tax=Aurantibrevibacter litoralis TaxID=3106030 RepID=UPI002AFE9A19|nr:DUF4382 domain-containing protein [Arenibacter sp. GZD-96]MEA1785363.1 DUF4382 domain-containing protein [Arenibacter sp. GZD-96]